MLSDLPPLPWLRAFEAAARHLSFTDAGRELGLTQAAISKQVKSLEMHMRQDLFVRHIRSLSLTKTGEAYVPKVRDAFERLSIGTREVFGLRRSTELTVRCAVSFATNWLAPRLPDYLDRHPGKRVRIISSVWNDAFDSSLADLDIQYGNGDWKGIRSHRLTWETLTPVCAPALATTLIDPNDLVQHRLIHVLGYKDGWGSWLKAAGAKSVNAGQGLHVDTSLVAFEIAAHGGGVALGRKSLLAAARNAKTLAAPFQLEIAIEEAFYLLQPLEREAHPDSDVFTGWLTGLAARCVRT